MKILLKRNATAFLLALFLTSCGNQPAPEASQAGPTEDFIIVPGKRVGLITAEKSSREDVLKAYGENARVDSIYLGEGQMGLGVVVYPDIPKQRVEFFWDDELDALKPSFIKIEGLGVADGGSVWKTDNGITIGTKLAELEAINGRPFKFLGFEWDFGGNVSDWNGGKITDLGLALEPDYSKELNEGLMGDVELMSNDPKVLAANPAVAKIYISFRQPKE